MADSEYTGDTSLFIGRFQPLHPGHVKLFRSVLNEGGKVCVGLRDTKLDEKNPYSVGERAIMIVKEFGKEIEDGTLTYVTLPDVKDVVFGRGKGWGIRQIKLDEATEAISATKIRYKNNTKAYTLLFTGLPCSGKTTLAKRIDEELKKINNIKTQTLDGDVIRKELWTDLKFSDNDRMENLKRVSYISQMLNKNNVWVLDSFVSPSTEVRNLMRSTIDNFIVIHVKCSAGECARRDVKGMWAKAKAGEIIGFTGFSSPYEEPLNAEITVDTEKNSIEYCVKQIVESLKEQKII